MSLADLIRGKSVSGEFATATPATFATQAGERGRTVASVATVAVANPGDEKTAPPANASRTCAGCRNYTRYRNCAQPVEAGLVERFELIGAPEGHAATCPSFKPRAKFDTEKVTEAFEERAAILEYDAGLEREQAEAEAWRILLRDGTVLTSYFDPPMTRAQVMAAVSDVADLEPLPPAEPTGELSRQDEAHLRAWLALIGETDERMVCAVLEQCRGDGDALAYYLNLARKRP